MAKHDGRITALVRGVAKAEALAGPQEVEMVTVEMTPELAEAMAEAEAAIGRPLSGMTMEETKEALFALPEGVWPKLARAMTVAPVLEGGPHG